MINSLKKLWSIPLVRNVVNTFWQGFLGVFLVGVPLVLATVHRGNLQTGEHVIIGLLGASTAAGFSAVKTVISAYIRTRKA